MADGDPRARRLYERLGFRSTGHRQPLSSAPEVGEDLLQRVLDDAGRSGVLVTGMSGTGKSTVLAELARRGHRVVDTDEPGWVVQEHPADEPMWDLDRVRALLAGHRSGRLYVAGCVADQGALYGAFDEVVLLSAPLEVVLARVTDRANPYGSTAQDRARIEADLRDVEPRLRARADREVVTTVPVAEVATALQRTGAEVDTAFDP